MKALHIDFVPSTQWRTIWLVAAIAAVTMAAIALPKYLNLYQVQRNLDQSIADLRKQATAPAIPVMVPIDPRFANAQTAAEMLQLDLNRVFTLIESIKEPSTRLRNLSIDSAAGTARVDYELDSIPRASALTAALNAGYDQAPWRLESISAIAAGFAPTSGVGTGQTANPSAAGLYRAQWSANINKL
jgi:hypothetical protein